MEVARLFFFVVTITMVSAQDNLPALPIQCPGPIEERTASYWTSIHDLKPYPLGGSYKMVHFSNTKLPSSSSQNNQTNSRMLNSAYFLLYKENESSYFRQHEAETLITLMHGRAVKVYVLEPEYGDLYTFTLSKRGRTTLFIKQDDIFAIEMRGNKTGTYSLLSLSFTPSVNLANEQEVKALSRSFLMVKYPHLSDILMKLTPIDMK